jgi:hypothetical protein
MTVFAYAGPDRRVALAKAGAVVFDAMEELPSLLAGRDGSAERGAK